MTATVEVAGPFKIETKPYEIKTAVGQQGEEPDDNAGGSGAGGSGAQ